MPHRIGSTSDSQTGGSYFPSSENTSDFESFVRERSASQPSSFRRHNLSLNISSLPTPFQYQQSAGFASPSSFASSAAPYTDSFSYPNPQNVQDYFAFDEASLPSATEPSSSYTEVPPPPHIFQAQQYGYRLPASQPSSPVRSIYPPGQAPYVFQPGRQRGATFSGTYSPYVDYTNSPSAPLYALSQAPIPASAVPPHLAYTANPHAPIHSPLAASPHIGGSGEIGYFTEVQATQEVSMEDVKTPTPANLGILAREGVNHRDQGLTREEGLMVMDMSAEMVDKLTLLDKIVTSAQSAKDAMLRGREVEVSASLGHLSNQLEIASELGVGPAPTPREGSTSSGVSPPNYQASPVVSNYQSSPMSAYPTPMVQMAYSTKPVIIQPSPVILQPTPIQPDYSHAAAQNIVMGMTQPTMVMTSGPTSSLLPSLPVETLRRVSPIPPPILTPSPVPGYMMDQPMSADFTSSQQSSLPVPPPLIHSHSFPNGHQLPSQIHGITSPTTPVVPSPSFTASLGIPHVPLVSSPLATMPVSRAQTPPPPISGSGSSSGSRTYPIPEQPLEEEAATVQIPEATLIQRSESEMPMRRVSQKDKDRESREMRSDGRPVVTRSRSTSVHKWNTAFPTMTNGNGTGGSTAPPSAWQSRQGSPEDEDDEESEDEGVSRKLKRRRSSVGRDDMPDMTSGAVISDDIRRQLDQIFEEFLNRVCSDLDVVDNKGEKLHQVLMPKKMARLDESTDYRPFKFRIQAFTNAFHEELLNRGITEETMSAKKIKTYLWRQDLISRFNADGKKAKSKGNHIWNVDAKRLSGGGWVFRPFNRRIIGQPNAFALVNQRYEWEPKVWDPQAASETIHPVFKSPSGTLPPWLKWEEGKLVGIPIEPSGPITITALAEFNDISGMKCTLETSFNVQAVLPHLMPAMDPAAIFQQATAAQAYPWPNEYDYQDPNMLTFQPYPQPGYLPPSSM